MRERSIQTLLLQSCIWRISLACSGRQCDRGDRVTRNGERREKEEERKMIQQLLSHPAAFFFLHTFLYAVPTILEQTGFISSGDQITSNRRSKHSQSGYVLCVAFILNGSQNEFWLHTCCACIIACVIATWRLVLRDI